MRVLVVGLNYAPERVGIAVYTTGMAEALAAKGHDIRVVAGQPYYPAWRIMAPHSAWRFTQNDENGVLVIRVPHYIPAVPTGGRRLLHHASFAVAALLPVLWNSLLWRPDVVMTIAPSLIAAPVARAIAFLVGAKSWLHVQDFEVEASFATGLLKDGGRMAKLARLFEKAVMKSFHRLSAISPEMCRRLIDKGVPGEKVLEFRNWADVDAIRPMKGPSPYRAEWKIATEQVALYAGNIANKQGIEIVLDAARRLSHRKDLTFVVCGEGPNRQRLEDLAAGSSNIQFHDLQPKERLNELMGLATIHLLPQMAGAADLVLPSKLTNMLASGRPVVATAAAGTGLAREVGGCGIVVAPGNADVFAEGIERLIDDQSAWTDAARAARTRAEDWWAKDKVLGRLEVALRSQAQPYPAVAGEGTPGVTGERDRPLAPLGPSKILSTPRGKS